MSDSPTRDALEALVTELRGHIDGLPDHPWIPGANFADGRLMAALRRAEAELEPPSAEYPEHAKMKAVKIESEAIGEFLDTAPYVLCETMEFSNHDVQLVPVAKSINQILAAYFGIDLDKIEQEKRAMLDKIRSQE